MLSGYEFGIWILEFGILLLLSFKVKKHLLYKLLKFWIGLALRIYARKIHLSHPEVLKQKGPLLLAVNHPNSFLDAIILDILFKEPVWSLARGDAFKSPFISKILFSLKMLPVYRVSEGVENLEENYKTFSDCKRIFLQDGVVLIFSEGKCINEWHLRPLKKGTARLAFSCWEDKIPLTIQPIGINYNSFHRTGKNIFIYCGEPITRKDFPAGISDGKSNILFNDKLRASLEQLVYEIPATDIEKKKEKLTVQIPVLLKMLLFIPAIPGWIINAPFYYSMKAITYARTKGIDHYDSIMLALLSIFYPVYLLVISLTAYLISGNAWVFALWMVAPLTGKACIYLNRQLD